MTRRIENVAREEMIFRDDEDQSLLMLPAIFVEDYLNTKKETKY
jgi:hypothetical protein